MGRRRVLLFFVLPGTIWLVAFTAFPLLYAVYASLYDLNLSRLSSASFVGIQNFVLVMKDRYFLNALMVTGLYCFGAVGIEILFGLGVALLLHRKFCGRSFARSVVMLPIMMTPVIVGLIWKILMNPFYGFLNYVLGMLSLPKPLWLDDTRTALISTILVDVWQWTPMAAIIVLSGLQSLPEEPFDSAKIDGASAFQIFRYLTLPLLKPAIMVVLLIRLMDTIRIFDTIFVLTKGGPGISTEVISIYIYRIAFRHFNIGYATALSFITLIIIVIVSQLFIRSIRAYSR